LWVGYFDHRDIPSISCPILAFDDHYAARSARNLPNIWRHDQQFLI